MKIKSDIIHYVHLDKNYSLLSGKSVRVMFEYFSLLDIHGHGGLNDVQFYHFMKSITDLKRDEIYKVFDTLDVDGSGEIEFDEFYLLICILIAIKDNEEKQFIYRHSRTVFDLLDEDGSNSISADEFGKVGFMFNFQGDAVKGIFNEFDVSGDQELDYKEFRMFAMACIDKQNDNADETRRKLENKRRLAMLKERKRHVRDLQKRGLLSDEAMLQRHHSGSDDTSDDDDSPKPDFAFTKVKEPMFADSYAYASLWCTII